MMRVVPRWALACLLVIASPNAHLARAQDRTTEAGIRAAVGQYWSAVQRKDHEATLSFIDPRLFALVPRERMLAALERSSADTTVRVAWGDAEVTRVSRPVKDQAITYALVHYRYDLWMRLSAEPDTDVERKASFMTGMLEEQYGIGNVHYAGDGAYAIQAERELVAVLDPQVGAWRFLERKPALEPLLDQLIPAKVLKKLK